MLKLQLKIDSVEINFREISKLFDKNKMHLFTSRQRPAELQKNGVI